MQKENIFLWIYENENKEHNNITKARWTKKYSQRPFVVSGAAFNEKIMGKNSIVFFSYTFCSNIQ